jgi:MoxR-like ATPase
LDYIQALLTFSRQSSHFRGGLSPRAGLALLRAARAWALLHQRDHVLPEDVQTVLPAVVGHRLHPSEDHLEQSTSASGRAQLRAGVALPL